MAYSWGTIFSAFNTALSASAITVSVTYAAHDRVQVEISYASATSITETVSDGTNTYTKLKTVNLSSQTYVLYECKDAAAGTFTLSFTPGSAQSFRGVAAFTQSGLSNTTAAVSAGNSQTSPGTGTNAITSTNLTPGSQPGGLIGVSIDDNGTATAVNAGTGFTNRGTIANWEAASGIITRVEDERLTSTSAIAATFTGTGSPGVLATLAAFVPEPAGGAATFPPVPSVLNSLPTLLTM